MKNLFTFQVEKFLPLIIFLFISVQTNFGFFDENNSPQTAFSDSCRTFYTDSADFYALQSEAEAVVTADFNNDGIPDLAATVPFSGVAVMLGNNQRGFSAPQYISAAGAKNLTFGDFNRDGEFDLAVTANFEHKVYILSGDGAGGFALTQTVTVGQEVPDDIVSADFNGDGWADLATANQVSDTVGILRGGQNGFTVVSAVENLSGNPDALTTADFNGDRRFDLAVTAVNSGSPSTSFVRVFISNAQGGFGTPLNLQTGESYALATADFNKDGFADLVAGGQSFPNRTRIFLGDGGGGFATAIEFDTEQVWSIVTADFNNDNNTDVLAGTTMILGNGNGSFSSLRAHYSTVGSSAAAADFDGDGNMDFATTGPFGSNQPRNTLSVHRGLGNGKFPSPVQINAGLNTQSVVTADFNNDGRLDVASASPQFNSIHIQFQNPDGSFTGGSWAFSFGGSSALQFTLAVGDFNNDGYKDLAISQWWARSVIILLNNGTGQFTSSTVSLPMTVSHPENLKSADFNADGKDDLVVYNRGSNNYTILLGTGTGTFTVVPGQTVPFNSTGTARIIVGDFNNDNKQDFMVSKSASLIIATYHGNGDGTFVNFGIISVLFGSDMIKTADMNNDGNLDVISVSANNGALLRVMFGNGMGQFPAFTDYTMPGGGANDVLIGDFDLDSKKDLITLNGMNGNSELGFYKGDGMGGFSLNRRIALYRDPTYGSTGDFNNDGKLDFVLSGGAYQLGAYLNKTNSGPCFAINDVSVNEPNSGTTTAQFTVNLSEVQTEPVTVDYRLVGRSAAVGADFDNAAGTLTFSAGETSKTINVAVRGDVLDEADTEIFNVQLSNPVNAFFSDSQGVGSINDNEEVPTIVIGDASIIEGNEGSPQMNFTVSLSNVSGRKAKAKFATQNGTANSPTDFATTTGTVFFNPNETSKNVTVSINPDTLVEPNESFNLNLTDPTNATIADNSAVGTILNDDIGGTVEFSAAVYEFNEASGTATITVMRNGGNASGIVLEFSTTTGGTATAGQDYQTTSGTLTFGANEATKTFTVQIINDTMDETEIETVNLSLQNIGGGATFGGRTTAVLNIIDNDVSQAKRFDFDGDGKTDISIFRPSAGEWWYQNSSTEQTQAVQFGTGTDKITPADFTGDGKTDIAFFRPSVGEWFILRSEDSSFYAFSFGTAGDVPVPADYDGDGKADAAVFRESTLTWFIQKSSGDTDIIGFGAAGDKPVVADYDGDGKADIAIYRPNGANGAEWWIRRSSNGSVFATQFGANTDKPVQGDYTGDGKTDIAFWQSASGNWFVLRSEDFSFYAFPFGANGDIPAPGDYDGDNKLDAGIFRPSNSTWFVQRSTAGILIQNFGITGDLPVPNAFVGN